MTARLDWYWDGTTIDQKDKSLRMKKTQFIDWPGHPNEQIRTIRKDKYKTRTLMNTGQNQGKETGRQQDHDTICTGHSYCLHTRFKIFVTSNSLCKLTLTSLKWMWVQLGVTDPTPLNVWPKPSDLHVKIRSDHVGRNYGLVTECNPCHNVLIVPKWTECKGIAV